MPSLSNQQFSQLVGGAGASKIATGSRMHLKLGGKVFGKGTIVSYGQNFNREPVIILDQAEVDEFVLTGYDVAFTGSRIIIVKKSLKELGWAPKWPAGTSSETFLLNALNLGDMTAEIFDSQLRETLAQIVGVQVVSTNIVFGARAIAGEDVAFVGKRVIEDVDL